ncbi:MAG: isochorismatase family protein [Desulfuromonadales bacterium]|nr:isochorismatase family protein [Desulfuromonadales bacterium]
MSNDFDKFKLDVDNAVLVVIDIQERLVPAMPQDVYLRLRDTVEMLINGAELLGFPVVTTEQYPKGIGHTVPELVGACKNTVIEKVSFGCCGEPNFLAALKETGRSQVIITGMETHVCVYQTVLGLLEDGYHVHLVRDAICSRNKTDYLTGVANSAQAGAVITTAETVLFQMLQKSTHEQFRAVSKLVKARG